MTIPSRFGELHIDGAVAICKFEEERRTVLTIASANTVRDTSVVVHQHAWMVVSKVASTELVKKRSAEAQPVPSAAALFQAFFRIHSEKPESTNSLDTTRLAPALSNEKTKHVAEIVIEALGEHMRQHMAELQTSLLSEAENLAANLLEFKCPLPGCPC